MHLQTEYRNASGIPPELIKYGTEKLFTSLTKIINNCLNGHPVPKKHNVIMCDVYINNVKKHT